MQRREFCKLIAAAAATRALPAKGQSAAGAPSGFNKLHQTYEEFCATPESQRTFYALVDGKIVENNLKTADWSPTEWGEAPELPGGSWDAPRTPAHCSLSHWPITMTPSTAGDRNISPGTLSATDRIVTW